MRGILMAGALMLALWQWPTSSFAGATTGKDLKEVCGKDFTVLPEARAYCTGFIIATFEGMWGGSAVTHYKLGHIGPDAGYARHVNKSLGFCVPDGTSNAKIIRAFRRYLDVHESQLFALATTLFRRAMAENFPCE